MEKHYYVTPYENGCLIERDGDGPVSIHKNEVDAIRYACDLAAEHGGQVFVRKPQAGRCRPYRKPSTAPATPPPEELGWRDRVVRALSPWRLL